MLAFSYGIDISEYKLKQKFFSLENAENFCSPPTTGKFHFLPFVAFLSKYFS